MDKNYEKLESITLLANTTFASPPALPELVHINDSALDVMVDFQYQHAATVTKDVSIGDALMEMKASNVHLLLVVDREAKILGIISSQIIQGERPYQMMQERRITHADITVEMMMRPFDEVLCLTLETVKHAKVGNIIQTLKCARRQYSLVLENTDSGKQIIRGYLSASQISKKIGSDVTGNLGFANSVAELQHVLKEFD